MHAPGWYPDPTSRHRERYWDGERWREDVVDTDRRPTPVGAVAFRDGVDPAQQYGLRYWDGSAWTNDVPFTDRSHPFSRRIPTSRRRP
jgi:hypothetical protein